MTTLIQNWLQRQLIQARANGTVCKTCDRPIEKARMEWAKKNGREPPRYCYFCAQAYKRSPTND